METPLVPIGEAKTHLSKLIQRVERGEEIMLARGKVPVAKLVPLKSEDAEKKETSSAPHVVWRLCPSA